MGGNNPMIRIMAMGNWHTAQVRARWVQSGWRASEQTREGIERAWEEATKRPEVQLFDGEMCRLETYSATRDSLNLALSCTSYKIFFGTNMRQLELPAEAMANPL